MDKGKWSGNFVDLIAGMAAFGARVALKGTKFQVLTVLVRKSSCTGVGCICIHTFVTPTRLGFRSNTVRD